jgi:hypothetical protein
MKGCEMTEQPYFMVKVTRCGECPHFAFGGARQHRCAAVSITQFDRRYEIAQENFNGITPSCPMWAQRVQPKD